MAHKQVLELLAYSETSLWQTVKRHNEEGLAGLRDRRHSVRRGRTRCVRRGRTRCSIAPPEAVDIIYRNEHI